MKSLIRWFRYRFFLSGAMLFVLFFYPCTASALMDSTVVRIFDDQMIHFGDAASYETADIKAEEGGRIIRRKIRLPSFSQPMRIKARLLIYSTIQPGGSGGDPWDRAGSVLLSTPGMAHIELLKFITGFGGRSELYEDVTSLSPLLQDSVVIRGFVDTWVSPAWKMTFDLIFKPDTTLQPATWANGIYYTWGMTAPDVTNDSPSVRINIPPRGERVVLNYFTSGHCTDGSGADEFVSKDNVIFVDGIEVHRYKPWRTDCRQFRSVNPFSGRWGNTWSSDLSRSGWCPGDIVHPVQLDLSASLAPGPHVIRFAVENIRPQDNSGIGYWRVSSFLSGAGSLAGWSADRIQLSLENEKVHATSTQVPLRIDLADASGFPVFLATAEVLVSAEADSLLFSSDGLVWSNPFLCTVANGTAQVWMKSSLADTFTVNVAAANGSTLSPAAAVQVVYYDFEVKPGETNLARAGIASADCECNKTTENARKAIDGLLSTKWCCNNGVPDWLTVTLPDSQLINYFVIRHAGAGKAPAGDPGADDNAGQNSQNFNIQVMDSTGAWTDAVQVLDNPATDAGSVSYHALAQALRTDKIRLYLARPDVSRIYEFEFYHRDATPVSLQAGDEIVAPDSFTLSANYPNPFNQRTQFQVFIPAFARVQVSILNQRGQLVAHLLDGALPRGFHTLHWDGKNLQNQTVASGVYYINGRMTGPGGQRHMLVRAMSYIR